MYSAMEGFLANRNLCADKKRMLQDVEVLYLQKLLKQKFQDWRYRLYHKFEIREKRQTLYSVIQNVDSQVI